MLQWLASYAADNASSIASGLEAVSGDCKLVEIGSTNSDIKLIMKNKQYGKEETCSTHSIGSFLTESAVVPKGFMKSIMLLSIRPTSLRQNVWLKPQNQPKCDNSDFWNSNSTPIIVIHSIVLQFFPGVVASG